MVAAQVAAASFRDIPPCLGAECFPEDLRRREIVQYCTFSERILAAIDTLRGDHNRFGFSVQVAAHTLLGRPLKPHFFSSAPSVLLRHIGSQFQSEPPTKLEYPVHWNSYQRHRQEIRGLLGLRVVGWRERGELLGWLSDRARHPLSFAQLRSEANVFLYTRGILLPTTSTLERMVHRARRLGEERVFREMVAASGPDERDRFEALGALVPEGSSTGFAAFFNPLGAPSAETLKDIIERIDTIRHLGVGKADLRGVPEETYHYWVQRKTSVDLLKQFDRDKRHGVMLLKLHALERMLVDAAMKMFDELMRRIWRRSENTTKDVGQQAAQKRPALYAALIEMIDLMVENAPDAGKVGQALLDRFSLSALGRLRSNAWALSYEEGQSFEH